MGAAILRQPIRGRGTSNPSINSANPLSRGLCAVSIPVGGQVVTLTQGGLSERFATKSGPAAITQGSVQALSVAYSSITTDSWRLIETANRLDTVFERPSSAVTAVAFVMRRGNNPNGTAPIFQRGSAVTSPYAAYSIMDYSGTGTLRGLVATGGTSYSATGSIIPNMRPIVLSTRYDGSKVEIFMGGVLDGSRSCSGTLSYPNASDSGVAIGNYYSYSATARSFNGDVYLTAVWDRALSDAEIKSISNDPFQLLQPQKRPLWVNTISGLISVSNDAILSYNLLSYAQQDKTIEWNTLNSVNTDGSVSWDINTSVTSDKTFSWDALNQVIADKVIEWNLEQYVQSDKGMSWDILNNVVSDGILSWNTTSSVTTDVNTTWNIVSSVFADKTINYDILVSANQDVSLSWNINQFVFADKGLVWDIESTMLTAFADLPLRYDIVSSVYRDFNTYWNLLQSTYSDNTISFNALNSVLQDQSIAWGISEAVVNDLIITANLLSATQQDLTLVWDSAGIVSGDLVIRYNITTQNVTLPPLERILVISQETRTIKIEQSSRIISIQ